MPNFACSHCTTPPLCSSVLYLCPIAIWNSSFEYLCRTFFTACRRLNCFWFRFVFCCRSSSCGFSVSSSVTSPELSSSFVPEPITGGGGGLQRCSRYCCGGVLISPSHITDVSTRKKRLESVGMDYFRLTTFCVSDYVDALT